MPSPREDVIDVASRVRARLADALDALDVLLEDGEADSITMAERQNLKVTRMSVLMAIGALNESPDLTGLTVRA